MTVGKLLFFGGIAGLILTAVLTVFVIKNLSSERKNLEQRLGEQY